MIKIEKLTANQYEILIRMDTDMYGSYAHFSDAVPNFDTLKIEIQYLKKAGLITYARGLMTEDGEVAGSGFGIAYDRQKEVGDLIEKYENEKRKKNPKTITISEFDAYYFLGLMKRELINKIGEEGYNTQDDQLMIRDLEDKLKAIKNA